MQFIVLLLLFETTMHASSSTEVLLKQPCSKTTLQAYECQQQVAGRVELFPLSLNRKLLRCSS